MFKSSFYFIFQLFLFIYLFIHSQVEGGSMNPHVSSTLSELNIFIEETIRQSVQKNDKKSQLREEVSIYLFPPFLLSIISFFMFYVLYLISSILF